MTKSEFIKEHKRLLRILKSGSKKQRMAEYAYQKKEMLEVIKKNGIGK